MSGKTPEEMRAEIAKLQANVDAATGLKKNVAENNLKAKKAAFVREISDMKGNATAEHRQLSAELQGKTAPNERVETGGAPKFASSFIAQANAGSNVARKMANPTAPAPKSPSEAAKQAAKIRSQLAREEEEEETQSLGGRSAGSIGSRASAAAADFSQGVTRAIMHGMQAVADNERLPVNIRDYFREMAEGRKLYLGAKKPTNKLDPNLATAVKQTAQAASSVARDRSEIAAMKDQIKAVVIGTREDLIKGVRTLKTDEDVKKVYTSTIDACRRIWEAQKLGDIAEFNQFLAKEQEKFSVEDIVSFAADKRDNQSDAGSVYSSASAVARAARQKLGEAAETVAKPFKQAGAAVSSRASDAYEAMQRLKTQQNKGQTQQAKPAAAKTQEDDTGSVASKSSVMSQMSQRARDLANKAYSKLPAAPTMPTFSRSTSAQPKGTVQTETKAAAVPPAPPSKVQAAMAAIKQQTAEKNETKQPTAGRPSSVKAPGELDAARKKLAETFGKPKAATSTAPASKQTTMPPNRPAPTLAAAQQPKPLTGNKGGAVAGALGADTEKKVKGILPRIKYDVEQGANVLDAINDYVGETEKEVRAAVEKALGVTGSEDAIKKKAPRAPVQAAPKIVQQAKPQTSTTPAFGAKAGGMSMMEEMAAKQKAKQESGGKAKSIEEQMEERRKQKEADAALNKGGNPFKGGGKKG